MGKKRDEKQQRPLPAAAPPLPAAECPASEVREVSRFSRVSEAIDDLFSACKSKFGSSMKATGRRPQHGDGLSSVEQIPLQGVSAAVSQATKRRLAELATWLSTSIAAQAVQPDGRSVEADLELCNAAIGASYSPAAASASSETHPPPVQAADDGKGVLKWLKLRGVLLDAEVDERSSTAVPPEQPPAQLPAQEGNAAKLVSSAALLVGARRARPTRAAYGATVSGSAVTLRSAVARLLGQNERRPKRHDAQGGALPPAPLGRWPG
jgi:hypothetical protein